MAVQVYDRELLVNILIYHQRVESGCHCGWAVLGGSFADHLADTYERHLARQWATECEEFGCHDPT